MLTQTPAFPLHATTSRRAPARAVAPIHAPGSAMDRAVRNAERIAQSDATVVITGETGTGKEVMARFIHQQSARSNGPFIPINCSAIPEHLLESELFGQDKQGAMRKGRIAAADGGTLFLDEVGELSAALQMKLLRVLQERVYEPVGGTESRRAEFRLIAATTRDLAADVEAGRFRRDLYYRLFVCPVALPSLRERPEDISALFDHFWSARGETRPVEPTVYDALKQHTWPGNVRELENVVERVSIRAEGPRVLAKDLPMLAPAAASPSSTEAAFTAGSPQAILEQELAAVLQRHALPGQLANLLTWMENMLIDRALAESHGNKKAAADLLGLQRTTLVEKLRRRQKAGGVELCGTPAIAPAPVDGTSTLAG